MVCRSSVVHVMSQHREDDDVAKNFSFVTNQTKKKRSDFYCSTRKSSKARDQTTRKLAKCYQYVENRLGHRVTQVILNQVAQVDMQLYGGYPKEVAIIFLYWLVKGDKIDCYTGSQNLT